MSGSPRDTEGPVVAHAVAADDATTQTVVEEHIDASDASDDAEEADASNAGADPSPDAPTDSASDSSDPTPDSSGTAPLVARATTVAKSPARRRRRTTVTFYLTDALRNRARAVYRATSFDERDGSWSEMLTKALLAEVERRELVHNDGRPFIANGEPLTPGRPIGF